jgi:glutathione S-transferase
MIGAKPTGDIDGIPLYTLPVIRDSATGIVVSDSYRIAQYLDTAYPHMPLVFPAHTHALQALFLDVVSSRALNSTFIVVLEATVAQLPQRSQAYFRRTHMAHFGKPLEEVSPPGPMREQSVRDSLAVFSMAYKLLQANDEGQIFITGSVPSFADITLASTLVWIKRVLGEESEEWKQYLAADGGFWGRYLNAVAKWEFVDEEGLRSSSKFEICPY